MNYQDILGSLALKDERIMVLTAENRALIRQMPNLIGDRFLDTGITEQTLVGMAAGLASRGRIPVCHALAAFLTMRAYEFIRTDVSLPCLPVKLCGFIPGLLSDGNGPTHQAIEDVSLMRLLPNFQVFAPADEEDLLSMLPGIIYSDKPAYLRLNHLPGEYKHEKFHIGKAEIIKTGGEITILVYGFLFNNVLQATEILRKQGIHANLINIRSIKPLDVETILCFIESSILTVTIEDHFISGGLFSQISEIMIQHQSITPVLPIGFDNRWFRPGRLSEVIQNEGFNPEQIAKRIKDKLLC